MDQIVNYFKENIPFQIRLFLGKALLFFIAWKLFYSLFFFNPQLLDTPLTKHVGSASAYLLNKLNVNSNDYTSLIETYHSNVDGEDLENKAATIYHKDTKILHIANACNGLELLILYIGFIICMPSSIFRKIKYLILGVIVLDFVNILRCIGLIYLYEYLEVYFEFAHHFLFKAVIYTTTLVIWLIYVRKISINDQSV